MLFALEEIADLEAVTRLPGFEEAGIETAQAVLEECAKLCEGVLAPLNEAGDRDPATFNDGSVVTTPGFKQAFRQYSEGGWQGLPHPVEFGGQGLPKAIDAACVEMTNSANLSSARSCSRTARATTCNASASSTSWASRPARPPCFSSATGAAQPRT
jgi:alkylation response protein AidB-like acyl-CoA dehydrogenase